MQTQLRHPRLKNRLARLYPIFTAVILIQIFSPLVPLFLFCFFSDALFRAYFTLGYALGCFLLAIEVFTIFIVSAVSCDLGFGCWSGYWAFLIQQQGCNISCKTWYIIAITIPIILGSISGFLFHVGFYMILEAERESCLLDIENFQTDVTITNIDSIENQAREDFAALHGKIHGQGHAQKEENDVSENNQHNE